MTKCGQVECQEQASAKVYWPGRDALPMCLRCVARAQGVADVMGFSLVIEELWAEEPKFRGEVP